jgi:Glycosyltransferase
MQKFSTNGHEVFIVSPTERRLKRPTSITLQNKTHLLKVRTLNLQKSNIIEKGIGTLLVEYQFLRAIKKYLSKINFDIILYSTPPITFTKIVKHIKENHKAKSYLLLKDIFPQNAVDLGMIKENSLIHKFFRTKERQMYEVSDFIGCMSPANIEYLCRHNTFIKPEIVEINPNSIEPINKTFTQEQKMKIRGEYKIPLNKTVFVYGGNLGKPQGIDFLIDVIKSNIEIENCYFVIIGNGTEYPKIKEWFEFHQPSNATLMSGLPKKDYDNLVQACDVGLIFLDKHFSIPNYPSRLLSYLECKIPIIAATDKNSDIGLEAEKNGYGFWCESGNLKLINSKIESFLNNPELIKKMGDVGYNYLLANFTVDRSFSIIMNHLNK